MKKVFPFIFGMILPVIIFNVIRHHSAIINFFQQGYWKITLLIIGISFVAFVVCAFIHLGVQTCRFESLISKALRPSCDFSNTIDGTVYNVKRPYYSSDFAILLTFNNHVLKFDNMKRLIGCNGIERAETSKETFEKWLQIEEHNLKILMICLENKIRDKNDNIARILDKGL
jgi:hypothetical protein